jgi:hypothetical protein
MHLYKRKSESIPGTSDLTAANDHGIDIELNTPYKEEVETPQMSMLLSIILLAVVTAVSTIPPSTDDIT